MSSPNYPNAYWQVAGNNSNAIDLDSQKLIGLVTGAVFASTAVTVLAATTINGTYKTVKASNSGGAITFTVSTNGFYTFPVDTMMEFEACRFIKIAGGSSEVAGTTIELCLIPRQST